MKSRRSLTIVLLTGCLGWSYASFATPPAEKLSRPEIPSGCLLNVPADFSEYVITFTYASTPGANSGKARPAYLDSRLSKITTTKTGSVTREVTADARGMQTEVWYDRNFQYYHLPGIAEWMEASRTSRGDSNYTPIPQCGFRDLDWINPDSYAGTIASDKGSYLVFVPGGYRQIDLNHASDPKKKLEEQVKVAYIDADSRLPVALRETGVTKLYHFNPPPGAMQTFPPDLTEAIEKGRQGKRRLEQQPPRPY